jgi:hypothetical protein
MGAIGLVSWDLPGSPEQMKAYGGNVERWVGTTVSSPGTVEYAVYRNPLPTTPQVMAVQEYDSLASAQAAIASETIHALLGELRAAGCTNINVAVFESSPLLPGKIRPRG